MWGRLGRARLYYRRVPRLFAVFRAFLGVGGIKDEAPPYRRYGVVFRRWREGRKRTAAAVARRLGCERPFVSNLEAGRYPLPGHSLILLRMLALCPAAPAAVQHEQFLWQMSGGSLSLLHAAAKAVMGALGSESSMGGRLVPVPLRSLLEATWPPGDSAEAVAGGQTALYGGVWDIYTWPRAVLVDFLVECTEEWRWLFAATAGPEGRDGMISVTLRPGILSYLPIQQAAALRLHPPSFTLGEYVSPTAQGADRAPPPRAPRRRKE